MTIKETKNQMTVSELIEALKKFPQDCVVWTEGCDCWGKAADVKFTNDEDDKYILIERDR